MPSIDVQAPLRAIYDQWTRFEDFPQFIPGLEALRRVGATQLRGRSAGGPFLARVVEQHLDDRVAWRTLSGPHHEGTVTLRPLAGAVQVELELSGDAGDAEEALERFKALVERRAPRPGLRADVLLPGATRGLGDDASVVVG